MYVPSGHGGESSQLNGGQCSFRGHMIEVQGRSIIQVRGDLVNSSRVSVLCRNLISMQKKSRFFLEFFYQQRELLIGKSLAQGTEALRWDVSHTFDMYI